jgi:hypothetical protein
LTSSQKEGIRLTSSQKEGIRLTSSRKERNRLTFHPPLGAEWVLELQKVKTIDATAMAPSTHTHPTLHRAKLSL